MSGGGVETTAAAIRVGKLLRIVHGGCHPLANAARVKRRRHRRCAGLCVKGRVVRVGARGTAGSVEVAQRICNAFVVAAPAQDDSGEDDEQEDDARANGNAGNGTGVTGQR